MSGPNSVNLAGMAEQSLVRQYGSGYADLLTNRNASGAPRLPGAGAVGGSKDAARAALAQASEEFESIFVYQMVSAMRKTVGEGSFLPKSNAQEIFEGMLDEEWSKKLAGKSGPGGLSDLLYRQLSRQMGLGESSDESDDSLAQSKTPYGIFDSAGHTSSPLLELVNSNALIAPHIKDSDRK